MFLNVYEVNDLCEVKLSYLCDIDVGCNSCRTVEEDTMVLRMRNNTMKTPNSTKVKKVVVKWRYRDHYFHFYKY